MLTRLLVLWLLSERPLHGYRIRRILAEPGFAAWWRIEDASVYSLLKTLLKEGHVTAEEPPATTGRGPAPKAQYRITAAGRKHYAALLVDAWREPLPLAQPIQLALAAVADLPAGALAGLVDDRRKVVDGQRQRIAAARSSAPHPALVDRSLGLLDAELAWLDAFSATVEGAPQ